MTHADANGPDALAAAGWVVSRNAGPKFRTALHAAEHDFAADEPLAVGGDDSGPTPYDYLLASIGACTAMTVRMYASRKGWPLEEAVVAVRTARSHAADCEECVARPGTLAPLRLERHVELRGALSDEQQARLLEIADRCPVKLALGRGVEVIATEGA